VRTGSCTATAAPAARSSSTVPRDGPPIVRCGTTSSNSPPYGKVGERRADDGDQAAELVLRLGREPQHVLAEPVDTGEDGVERNEVIQRLAKPVDVRDPQVGRRDERVEHGHVRGDTARGRRIQEQAVLSHHGVRLRHGHDDPGRGQAVEVPPRDVRRRHQAVTGG
jgi:hypothetical protein